MKILFKTLIFYFLFNVSAIASNSIADCQVSMGDEDLFKGRCSFYVEKGGSFSLSSLTNCSGQVNSDTILGCFQQALAATRY
jgi:hypothetical protein